MNHSKYSPVAVDVIFLQTFCGYVIFRYLTHLITLNIILLVVQMPEWKAITQGRSGVKIR